jgi:putative transposase
LIRYIHLNPVRAGIVKNIEELEKYPWTGHGVIMGNYNQKWMDIDYVLLQFGSKLKTARREYRQFVEEGLSQGHISELTGGGMLRSYGGWSEVLSMRHRGAEFDFDGRILGSSEFVKRVAEETVCDQNRRIQISTSTKTISDIIKEECSVAGISQRLLQSGNRRRNVSRARVLITRRCLEELGMSFADIARCLGVTTSAISRAFLRNIN